MEPRQEQERVDSLIGKSDEQFCHMIRLGIER